MKFVKHILSIIGASLLGLSCHTLNRGGDIHNAKIWLIGETHGVDWIHDIHFTRWKELYDSGYRHLFIENAYYQGEYLNLWMGSDDEAILDDLFSDWEGIANHTQGYYELLKNIKRECPLTVFHGVDVGQQYWLSGERFREYLIKHNLQDSEQYALTVEAIEQGARLYDENTSEYDRWKDREYTMAQNFIREYDKLGNERIMGIFGYAHTNYNKRAFYGNYPNMAKQLRIRYGKIIYFENYIHLIR
jgi:hypothetical protein